MCAAAMTAAVLLTGYFAAFFILVVFSLHRLWLIRLTRIFQAPSFQNRIVEFPLVTIQLPIYNERFVAERLLRAVFALDYPPERLEVQILDDSTDDTTDLIDRLIGECAPATLEVRHIRRGSRTGYKAGALAAGAACARGDFYLIIDADFVPQRSLLRDLLPPMRDPRVAMVQARWAHINHDANRLTRAQALLLDGHFLIETQARHQAGLYFNFHGTAGLWRAAAVADAGGWQADTVTEDLDISYRAQMRGWQFVFLPHIAVPSELPEQLPAFRQQQARWAEGTIATARKHLRHLLCSSAPSRVKVEAVLHLTAHSIYPATLLVALLTLPSMWVRREFSSGWWIFADVLLAGAVLLPTRLFYRRAARLAGRDVPGLRDMPFLMMTGIALAVSNTRALLAGLAGTQPHFKRTPKFAQVARSARAVYDIRGGRGLRLIEGGVAAYLGIGVVIAAGAGMPVAVPMLSFLALAFGLACAKG
jgi:cellulose synthase/poly-beta-1,6-N-acetylglucosamine synthase-like glycosyltransferase